MNDNLEEDFDYAAFYRTTANSSLNQGPITGRTTFRMVGTQKIRFVFFVYI